SVSPQSLCCLLFRFFFFQAEDGIRDFHVTGVQTCALPISPTPLRFIDDTGTFHLRPFVYKVSNELNIETFQREYVEETDERYFRSEERRVGKECRPRQSPQY